jgi:SWIM zinc finger
MVLNFQKIYEIFLVTLDTTLFDVSCQCHLFEFKDILCHHVLVIFNKKYVDKKDSGRNFHSSFQKG